MMHATYWKDDDILEVRFSDKPIVREASENWHVHKSYAADGELVTVVFIDAVKGRLLHAGSERPRGCLT